MTTNDHAFIKAYYHDQAEATPPVPHVPAPGVAPDGEVQQAARSYGSARPSERQSPYAPEPWESGPFEPEANFAERVTAKAQEASAGRPGEVTVFVPPPHIPLPSGARRIGSERRRLALGEGRGLDDTADGDDSTSDSGDADSVGAVFDASSDSNEDCRPLSSFTSFSSLAKDTLVIEDFSPALEVDAFRWPRRCEELLAEGGDAWRSVVERVVQQQAQFDRSVLAVASCWRGEGRTTATLSLARLLAERARSSGSIGPAVVDADFQHPELATCLGLSLECGWEDALRSEMELREVMVTSLNERVTLLPIHSRVEEPAELCRQLAASVSLQVLRDNYAIVLVDLGPVLESSSRETALTLVERTGIEGAILIRDANRTSDEHLAEASRLLSEAGAPVVGAIENFCVGAGGWTTTG